jgi:3-deoxy-D-manno-octulosonic-acid transferase
MTGMSSIFVDIFNGQFLFFKRKTMNIVLRWLANIGYLVAGILFLPVAVYRMIREGRYLRGGKNRLGLVPLRLGERPGIWIHAVSMGEVNAAKPLADRLKQQLPFHEIFISTNTDTGYDRAVKLFGEDFVFFSPFDFSFCVSRAIKRLRPALIVTMELEVWPNMLSLARDRNIPVVVANGRITEKSLGRYKMESSRLCWCRTTCIGSGFWNWAWIPAKW